MTFKRDPKTTMVHLIEPLETRVYDPSREKSKSIVITGGETASDTVEVVMESFWDIGCDELIFIPTELFNEISTDTPITANIPYVLCFVNAVYGDSTIGVIQVLFEQMNELDAQIKTLCMLSGVTFSYAYQTDPLN